MLTLIINLVGGLGLLLIGMSMMTDGLKLASGNALRDILALWTNSRIRGLFSGFLITGVVQSSGAVTVATIGFANAGLLTLERSIWVIYGSNVGTTVTAWIVALIGFRLDIEAFALPLIALGALLKLTGAKSARASSGIAIVGFGLLFLGIGILKTAFEGLGTSVSLPELTSFGFTTIFLLVLTGFILTTLMQSSSAAMVIALSAAAGGIIPLNAAAAVVIGANLGSTTTAAFTVIGATATAKRVAISHLIFNLCTASLAILILNPMLWLVSVTGDAINLQSSPATALAIFHTLFNVLGVLLMWPLSSRMIAILEKAFTTQEELESRPRYLDNSVLALPYIALDAMALEVSRINQMTVSAIKSALNLHPANAHQSFETGTIRNLANAIVRYAVQINHNELTPFLSQAIATLMESIQSFMLVVNIGEDLSRRKIAENINLTPEIQQSLEQYLMVVKQHLDIQDLSRPAFMEPETSSYGQVESAYSTLKSIILNSASRGELAMDEADRLLQYTNQVKRLSRQLLKGTRRLVSVRDSLQRDTQALVQPSELSDQVNLEKLLQVEDQLAEQDKREI